MTPITKIYLNNIMRNILFIIILLILVVLYKLQLEASQETNKRLNSIENKININTINSAE
jgi:hypothetical protein